MAVIFMLVVVGLVLSAFAGFFVYLMRRARMAADEARPAAAAGHAPAEGTAQC